MTFILQLGDAEIIRVHKIDFNYCRNLPAPFRKVKFCAHKAY